MYLNWLDIASYERVSISESGGCEAIIDGRIRCVGVSVGIALR